MSFVYAIASKVRRRASIGKKWRATSSITLMVDAAESGAERLAIIVPAVPMTVCDGLPCWRGLELAAGESLVLFSRPPNAGEVPTPAPLFGEALRLPLDSLASAGDSGDLQWTVVSSDEAVAMAYVAGDELVVEPADDFAEGEVRVDVVATDATGQSVAMSFAVNVEFYWPVRPIGGWRGTVRAAE